MNPSLTDNPLRYFGEHWGVPMLDGAHKAATPVGAPCRICYERIEEGERGVIRPAWRPVHRECDARLVLGGYNHIMRRCSCYGGDQEPDPPELTKRQAAIACWVAFTGEP